MKRLLYFGLIAAVPAASLAADTPDAQSVAQAPQKPADPFSFADFSWAPASYAPPDSPMATKYFVPELRADVAYNQSFNNPADDTISGSSEVFRHGEFQVTQLGVGGDFNYNNVNLRLMTQFGMYSTTTPRNDASSSRGQWDLSDAYRYVSEAYAGYHIDALNGINIQAGIFMSYIGLWSYYNFDNWTYQPSYVSSNTPWFFNGMRVQIFPSDKLKIEPWLINGWQSYGKFNNTPGVGAQILWKPTGSFVVLGNQYYGSDELGTPDRRRVHTDDSAMVKYYEDQATGGLSKGAASLTFDAGCEMGDGVTCGTQYFLGFMAYNRLWFDHDKFGLTFGGGAISNPGQYLVLLPPINGATAASGTPYFPESPGSPFIAWDMQLTGDYMPTRNITFRLEFTRRQASVPYFSGPGGVTPPSLSTPGTYQNQGAPGSTAYNPDGSVWNPDLQKMENRMTVAMMVRL